MILTLKVYKVHMNRKKILLICGSLNQTMMMYQISNHLKDDDLYFTPYFADGFLKILAKYGFLDRSILGWGSKFREETLQFLNSRGCELDEEGLKHDYDLVLTCSDLVIPKSIRNKKVVLVQEGMTDPENWTFHLIRKFKLPGWLAFNTSVTGLSDQYMRFCVASEGYRDLFVNKGINSEKVVVTGIPNFDYAESYLENNFPYRNYVLLATSDMRETLRFENRRRTILEAINIAAGKSIIFKLHPNEDHQRAIREIREIVPDAIIFTEGNAHQMVANCDVLITKYSSIVYTAIALGKTIYADADLDQLRKLAPLQNGGSSAERIAKVCSELVR